MQASQSHVEKSYVEKEALLNFREHFPKEAQQPQWMWHHSQQIRLGVKFFLEQRRFGPLWPLMLDVRILIRAGSCPWSMELRSSKIMVLLNESEGRRMLCHLLCKVIIY